MRPTEPNKMPLARCEGLLVEPVGDETIAYDLETKEAHCLRPVAAFVFARCDGETSVADIAAASRDEFSRAITEAEVFDAVSQLEQIRLLEATTLLVVDGNGGFSRRDVMRMGYAGAAATVGTGLVMSIAAPTALAACSGQPAGCACTQNKECAMNHCCKTAGSNDKCNNGCCSQFNNGGDCQCQPNGMCASIPTPPNGAGCCNATVCTGTGGTVCSTTTGATGKTKATSGATLSTPAGGGGGGAVTPSTPPPSTSATPTTPTTSTTPAKGTSFK